MNCAVVLVRRGLALWLGMLAAATDLPATAGELPLAAGVARVELTPPLELKATLGGYGARMNRPAVGVHDAVWAKALFLTRGTNRFVVVTADILGFPPKFRAAVLERLAGEGWSAAQVLLLPSHSHTSIEMMALNPANVFGIPQVGVFHKELFELTATRLAQVIHDAARDPTAVVAGAAVMPVPDRNRNRRAGNTTHDTDLTVTRVDTTAGRPLAVLVNWTAHPTFMAAEDMSFSGDWPGHLQRTLEALIGQGVTAMFYNGAEGDQSPMPPREGASRWERAERYGRELGIVAWRQWEGIRPREVSQFAYESGVIALPKPAWHPDFMKTGGAEYGLSEVLMRGFVEALCPKQTHTVCLRLDDLVIAGVPGEMAAGLGMDLKSRARAATGARCVTIGGLANEWVSYILAPPEYVKGGYEASVSFYGETLGPTVVEGVLGVAARLK